MKTSAPFALSLDRSSTDVQVTEPGADELRQGLADCAFVGFYQPQLSLKNGTICGLEVLARWQHPHKGLLTPGDFLHALEHHNLMNQLFLRLFEQGLALRQKLACLNLPLTMSFNLQPSQLSNPMLSQAIKVLLRVHECPAQRITFEITETGTLDTCSIVMSNLVQLKLLGCGLSMDDFGTGFSTLERLCDVPFSELKLDASFVQKLETHSACKAIITRTVSLAASLGLSLVIEGVETTAQLKQLEALGVCTVQGDAIAPPMAASALLPYMLEYIAGFRVVLTSV